MLAVLRLTVATNLGPTVIGDGMKRKHIGSRFEDFLAEDGIFEECRAAAIRFKIGHGKWLIRQRNSRAAMAKRRSIGRRDA